MEPPQQEPTGTTSKKNFVDNSSVLVFTVPLVKKLSHPSVRLAPNYVGVRRVRPSHRGIVKAKLSSSSTTTTGGEIAVNLPQNNSAVVFKIKDENGKERRMTSQEKKALKYKIAQDKKIAKKRKAEGTVEGSSINLPSINSNTVNLEVLEKAPINDGRDNTNKTYHQLIVDSAALEQELAELRGDRAGLPPALLSPHMARVAHNIVPEMSTQIEGAMDDEAQRKRTFVVYDEKLSQQWAESLKQSMLPAETVRQGENMRPMAYQLTPEVWSRLRPARNEARIEIPHPSLLCQAVLPLQSLESDCSSSVSVPKKCDWSSSTCRPPFSEYDIDVSIVFDYLYRETSFFLSCGAKFGADFSIYDGPREERHAFAGIRVLKSASKDCLLPSPSAYSLAGYVRCLNTAGKLALLATVVHDVESSSSSGDQIVVCRIALVDLALEKVLSAPTHQYHGRTEVRRDVTQNLAK